MTYGKKILTKDGRECLLRTATADDTEAMLDVFIKTHEETDFLASYADENSRDIEKERKFLDGLYNSENEVEILAFIDGKAVGTAGINAVGRKFKTRHRAEFGVCVLKDFWGLGIGRALTDACVECAKKAGYAQLELDVVAENAPAIALYKSVGFVEYGRNPRGFNSRLTGWQELVYMRLELK
ncbi:MAG: GNAT family N-acetyltransferase [Clostridia bacterium]|nr:GNAT family N-acetyltransferase [Clostridia bacterium]